MKIELNKKSKSVILGYAICLFVYVLAFLIIPFNKNAASWISFAFTVIAIVASLVVAGYAFTAKDTIVSKIYGYPIFRVGAYYAIVQLAVGIVICVIAAFVAVPYWVALLVSILLLAAAAIGVLITDNARDIIEEADESIKADTKTAARFQISIAGIVDSCDDPNIKTELIKLNELFTYSDPVSSDATKSAEDAIEEMLIELKSLVTDGNADDTKALIKNLTNALKERNRICKANKA